jgi:hypothetical protein
MSWTSFSGWLSENVLTLVVLAALFGTLSVISGMLAGYAGHLEAVAAQSEAAKANEAAAKANERAAIANQKAAEATLALEKFKADRKLTDAQASSLALKMNAFSGQGYVLSASTDQDSMRLVRAIDSILIRAGWIRSPTAAAVTTDDGIAISVATEPGVRIQIAQSRASDNGLVERATALASALKAEGIEAVPPLISELDATPTLVQIRVGTKPK